MIDLLQPLPREEVVKAIERRGPRRIPLVLARWWGEGLEAQYGSRLDALARYPEDVECLLLDNPVSPERMGLSWSWPAGGARDAACVIDDWSRLEEFIARLPRPEDDPAFDALAEAARRARERDRYILFGWWNLFFERPWMLRGMERFLADLHLAPRRVHELLEAMGRTYGEYLCHGVRRLAPDGFWTSDDLGHQTGPMMGPALFHEMLYPHYRRLGKLAAELGLHFWLHSCGDNTLLLDDLIDAGVRVFHPVQKHTMDERAVAAGFGDRLAFLAGIDVQHILRESDPEGVRAEVRYLIDTFDRADGGMAIAAGNGIVAGTPLENIEAFLDEALRYGRRHRQRCGD